MDLMFWILIILALIIIGLGILAIFFIKKGEGKSRVDYYALFIMGIIWLIAGILLNNLILGILGIIFSILGIVNKKKWKKNKLNWKKLSKEQKRAFYLAMIMIFLLIVSGIILFLLTKAEIL